MAKQMPRRATYGMTPSTIKDIARKAEAYQMSKSAFVRLAVQMMPGEPTGERAASSSEDQAIPHLENCGTYLAKDNKGQWHYINHAGTWQGCPAPFVDMLTDSDKTASAGEEQ